MSWNGMTGVHIIQQNNNLWLSFLSPENFSLYRYNFFGASRSRKKHENHSLSIMGFVGGFFYNTRTRKASDGSVFFEFKGSVSENNIFKQGVDTRKKN